MKTIIAIMFNLIILVSCQSTTGNLSGSTLTAGQPTAGVKISLIGTSDKKYKTITGVDGSYSINELPFGKYLMVIQSQNRTASTEMQFNELMKHRSLVQQYLGAPISDDQIKILKEQSEKSIGLDALRYSQQMQQSSNDMIAAFAKKAGVDWNTAQDNSNKMILIEEVEVKGKEKKDIIL